MADVWISKWFVCHRRVAVDSGLINYENWTWSSIFLINHLRFLFHFRCVSFQHTSVLVKVVVLCSHYQHQWWKISTEKLQQPKEDGYSSLARDLNGFRAISALPSCVKVSLEQLDEGPGIAATLQAHNAKYHKLCRTYCSNSRLKRLISKEETSDSKSPKKLRSTIVTHSSPQGVRCCIICEGEDQKNLHRVATDNVDANLKSWAKTNENFQLLVNW